MSKTYDKKDRIIQAAMEVFRTQGFAKATVNQIVQLAGVAQGTFYLYFASKVEIVPGIAQKIISEQLKRLEAHDDEAFQELDKLVDILIDVSFAITNEHQKLITFCYSGMAYYDVLEKWEAVYAPYYRWLEEKLLFLKEKGEISDEYSMSYLSQLIIGSLEDGAENHYLFGVRPRQGIDLRGELKRFIINAVKR